MRDTLGDSDDLGRFEPTAPPVVSHHASKAYDEPPATTPWTLTTDSVCFKHTESEGCESFMPLL